MSDEPSPSSYAPFIALAVVLVLFVLALVGVLVAALIDLCRSRRLRLRPPQRSTRSVLRRSIAWPSSRTSSIYTIDPDGSDRIDLAHNGRVPTAAVIWSHDGQRLIFAESERNQIRVNSARPDGQETRVLYEGERTSEPFYLIWIAGRSARGLSGPDPAEGMQLHIAETDRPNSARAAVHRPAQLFVVVARQPGAARAHRRRARGSLCRHV